MLDPNFKNLFLQEMPSVSVIMNLMPTQSRPLAVITSLICANVSWQLARRDAALTRPTVWPCRPLQPSLEPLHLLHGDSVATFRPTKISASTPGCRGDGGCGSSRLKLVDRLCHTHGCLEWKEREGLRGEIGRLVQERSSSPQVIRQQALTSKIPYFPSL